MWSELVEELLGKVYKLVNSDFKQRLFSAGIVE
jgi:hypothetical protein